MLRNSPDTYLKKDVLFILRIIQVEFAVRVNIRPRDFPFNLVHLQFVLTFAQEISSCITRPLAVCFNICLGDLQAFGNVPPTPV
jgi:hypothetical protein